MLFLTAWAVKFGVKVYAPFSVIIIIILGLVHFFAFFKNTTFSLSLPSVIIGDAAAILLRQAERGCLKTELMWRKLK